MSRHDVFLCQLNRQRDEGVFRRRKHRTKPRIWMCIINKKLSTTALAYLVQQNKELPKRSRNI